MMLSRDQVKKGTIGNCSYIYNSRHITEYRYTPEGVNMQFIDDLIRGNVYVIGGKRYYYSEEFANHSSTVTVPDL